MIAHNEENIIGKTLDSVLWADEIVVVNCCSTDRTRAILNTYKKALIIDSDNNPNLNVNKNLAIDNCTSEWILCLDADEVVSDSLYEEIQNTLSGSGECDGFYIPRQNHFLGIVLRYSMIYPDYVLRLFRKGKGRFPVIHVHEALKLDGIKGYIKTPLLHYSYLTIESYISKLDFYTSFEAQVLTKRTLMDCLSRGSFKEKLRAVYWKIVPFKPLVRFIIKYIFNRGFLDGIWGFHYCLLSAFSDYIVGVKRKFIIENMK